MDDFWGWVSAQWEVISAWADRPLTNGYALVLMVVIAIQINAAANKVVGAIWSMNDDLAQRMPKRGHYHHEEWP